MSKLITIAVDAMGGDGAPIKVIDGITHHYKNNKNIFYKIFGDENHINPLIFILFPDRFFCTMKRFYIHISLSFIYC